MKMPEESPKLIQPKDHRAKIVIWADLTVSDTDILDESVTAEQIKQVLAGKFGLEDYKENLKTGVLIDLYYYTIQFARDNNFSKEQTSAIFSIVKRTHEVCTETPFGNVDQCFAYFRELVLCHAVKRPPHSIDLFNAMDVKKITDYVINTYFRHYKMYKYVFTPLVRLDLSMTYVGRPETPPPPVEEAVGDGEKEGGDKEGDGQLTEEGEEPIEKEESEAAKQLRALIKEHLSEEIGKLKLSMDEQLKSTEDVLNQKLASVEGSGTGTKSGRASTKGKKK